jgi:hypothetical protein
MTNSDAARVLGEAAIDGSCRPAQIAGIDWLPTFDALSTTPGACRKPLDSFQP